MFNVGFYLKLINGEYGASINVSDLVEGSQRVLQKIERFLATNELPGGAKFNHYRPARYFAENISSLKADLSKPQLDRFRKVFSALNEILQ
jgi:hypothetical protein